MNNKIFCCFPLAWQVWNKNPIHKQAFDSFEAFWRSCRSDLWFYLNNGYVLEPRFNKSGTDISWFREKPSRSRTKPVKSFDTMLLESEECKKFMYYHNWKKQIKYDALARGNLPWKELFREYKDATGEDLLQRAELKEKSITMGSISIDWMTRRVQIKR